MQIIINKNSLEQILINSQNFIDKKDASQITSHILLHADGEKLISKATDFETGISIQTTNLEIIQSGEVTANGKKLLDIVKILKDDNITLETDEEFLHIKQNRSKFKLPTFKASQYPEFPSINNRDQFKIEPIAFLQAIKKISPAIDTNNPKYELNGTLIDIREQYINFVATDTRRLAVYSLDQNLENHKAIIIPKKAISEIQKIFFDEMEIFYDENIFIIKSSNFTFFTKLINGKYPDYQRIIPKEHKYELTLNRNEMIEKLKQITTISYEMKLTFNRDKIIFESLNEDNIEAKTELEYNLPIEEEIYLAINSRYMLDFLANIEKDEFKLSYNDSTLPFVLKSHNFVTVVMPIMI